MTLKLKTVGSAVLTIIIANSTYADTSVENAFQSFANSWSYEAEAQSRNTTRSVSVIPSVENPVGLDWCNITLSIKENRRSPVVYEMTFGSTAFEFLPEASGSRVSGVYLLHPPTNSSIVSRLSTNNLGFPYTVRETDDLVILSNMHHTEREFSNACYALRQESERLATPSEDVVALFAIDLFGSTSPAMEDFEGAVMCGTNDEFSNEALLPLFRLVENRTQETHGEILNGLQSGDCDVGLVPTPIAQSFLSQNGNAESFSTVSFDE